MTELLQITPIRKGGNKAIYLCDYCKELVVSRLSHFKRKKRHFCSQGCYSNFRSELLPFNEQTSYKGVRQIGESKQVYHRRYVKSHPERIAHLKARRYARERSAEGSHELAQWQALKRIFRQKCGNCGEKNKLTKDHIMPLSENGTDYISNIQPLCRNCNSKKWKHIHQTPELLKG